MYGINGGVFLYLIKKEKNVRGDPAYYLKKGLKKRWIICSLLFNAVQPNTIILARANSLMIPTV
ncbi:hypothetical protein DTO10_16445 [Peribacillus butanolivorans]|uniref:Uncharacterized protein n=1 Tax=Peribacillus butanolivorans TaxID=421767 RepID=A0ABM6XMS8_9BACI|nr:hypothetical protein DTO10_16445 [Peribacillus butanolivorans]